MPSQSSTTTENTGGVRTYRRAEVVVVHKTSDRFGGLSNMAPHFPLRVNGVRILTTEALYQACRFPHLPDVQLEIIKQHSPMTAKMKSKPHREKTRKDWDKVRFQIMRWCLRVKLAQNYERFGYLLRSTEHRQIVEFSRKDGYWGAKPSEEDDGLLIGQNVLGRLLMELRDLHGNDSDGRLRSVSFMNIPDFRLFGEPIRAVHEEDGVDPTEGRQHSMNMEDLNTFTIKPKVRPHFETLLAAQFPRGSIFEYVETNTEDMLFRARVPLPKGVPQEFSRELLIAVSPEVQEDYHDLVDAGNRQRIDQGCVAFVQKCLASFDPEHGREESWMLSEALYTPAPLL